jgi:hypothetical protein
MPECHQLRGFNQQNATLISACIYTKTAEVIDLRFYFLC